MDGYTAFDAEIAKNTFSQGLQKSVGLKTPSASALLDVYKRLPFKIVRGNGSYVETEDGRSFLDFYSGHAVASLGHGHPRLLRALHEQVDKLLFYSNMAHLEHQEEAARLLADQLPESLDKVFLVNSGAEAVENALKVARLVTGRSEVVSFKEGFHGRTLGALGATGLERYRRTMGVDIEGHHLMVRGEIAPLEQLFKTREIAAVVVEPIQSLAGVIDVGLPFLRVLREMCHHFGAALIFDELQTGGGRVGLSYCYSGRMGLEPDLMTLGKGIAGGLPVAAVALGSRWAEGVGVGDLGTTFGGGPLACAALKTTLEILIEEDLYDQVEKRSVALRESLEPWFARLDVQVRGQGLLLGLKTSFPAASLHRDLLERGILTGTCDDPSVLRVMPPLNVKEQEIDFFVKQVSAALEKYEVLQ